MTGACASSVVVSFRRDPDRLAALARLAEAQDGVVSRAQLAMTGGSLSRLVRQDILRRVHRAVYAFGHRKLTREGRWRAALLACGPDAALSHLSAAAVHGLLVVSHATPPHVVVSGQRGVRIAGIRAHAGAVGAKDVELRRGVRVTRPMRTLVDLADVVSRRRLADAFDQAMLLGVYDHRELLACLERARGRRGLASLHRVLGDVGDDPPGYRSGRERQAFELLVAHGVEAPVVNAAIMLGDGAYREADLWFADVRLDAEIDGPHHRLPHRRRLDVARDRDLRQVGVHVARWPDSVLDDDPLGFVEGVASELKRLRAGGECENDRTCGRFRIQVPAGGHSATL